MRHAIIVQEMLKEYEKLTFHVENKAVISCPYINTNALKRADYDVDCLDITIKDNVAIFPPKYFDPLTSGKGSNLLNEETFSIHHYSASWTGNGQRLKRKFARIIGEQKIIKIKSFLKIDN